ncbi:MAG: hypothetical protein UY21_C0004G0027 [Microgenomates group bacterium GW2011_GWA1_48_10]|nr:MAG: hypothetical protein UY21_C0004G0027 [Microgenomates group bacterium GW2011_GWA1_48_10]
MSKAKIILYLLLFLALLGVADAGYLTLDHYRGAIPPCSLNNSLVDCGQVLRSPYSVIFGIPVSLFGLLHYSYLFFLVSVVLFRPHKIWRFLLLLEATIGFFLSLYFMYLQFFIIKYLCVYCTFSAVISTLIFILALPQAKFLKGELFPKKQK